MAAPPLELPLSDDEAARMLRLPEMDAGVVRQPDVVELIRRRRSRRAYGSEALTLEEVSYLLWATQAVTHKPGHGIWTIRTVPSAGARHPYDTYLVVSDVDGLSAGVYRYVASSHGLVLIDERDGLHDAFLEAVHGEAFVAEAPVCFIWACSPYRGEWRYHSLAHKSMLLDAGHICQSLYLAAESIGCGTCGIGGYWQEGIDRMLGLDGQDTFAVYMAPVGRVIGAS